MYAFGEVGIDETKNSVSIPVIGLGKPAIYMASLLCKKRYTVLPAQIASNEFIEKLVVEENLQQRYTKASHAIAMNPSEIKNNPLTMGRLIEAASAEIIEKDIDRFTLGCGGFIGVAKQLEEELRNGITDLVE